jgi:hypothetical protein
LLLASSFGLVARLAFNPETMNYYNYFTEIEEHFVRRRGKHLLISPMDWGLIAAWRDAGVPLQVALRGIDIAMDGFGARQRGSSKVNSLCYCHDSVMAEYANHLESHLGESSEGVNAPAGGHAASPEDEHGSEATLKLISERISEIKSSSEKHSSESTADGITRVIARLEEVRQNVESAGHVDSEALERDLAIIDELLLAQLRATIPPEQMIEWEKEAKKELKVYRKRLPKETYEKIRGNFIRDKIHRKFNIGELSIFRL